jgi:DNA-binding NarL/FixJ family response regulator
VIIVDDHPLVRHGLAKLINQEKDMEVCGEASGATDALELFTHQKADVAVIDLSLKDGDGLALIEHIRENHPSIKVLVSSMHDETLFAERVLHAGAKGYINKQEATTELIDAIRTILKGKIHLSTEMADRMLIQITDIERATETEPTERLSTRELEVFQMIGKGYATRQISEELQLSIKTIETHRASIKRKLNLETAAELTRRAVQWDLERESSAQT